jgi:hypothetical protein
VIMARTDAFAHEGERASLDRIHAYIEAGADMIFAEALYTLDDYRVFTDAVDVPVLANLTEFGLTPYFTIDELAAAGLLPEELVEITSVIGVVTIADTLSRALSQPERAFPDANVGEPHRQHVSGTTLERGWVPMVDPDRAEGFVKIMYEQVEGAAGFVFNVARALTSVPEALRDFFGAFFPNYSTHGDVRPGGLSRTQVELLATSTSAYNDCFY